MFVCDIGCPRSPGKRTRKNTTPGAAVRVTPDKLYSASDAHSPGPRGSWSASSSTVRRATPTQEYNLSLAEMRHYKDQDTMVLVLSQNSDPAEEAEYPVPMEQDTSELLDAEDDDTLAGYAEVASRLVKPSPLQLPVYHPEDSTQDTARRLFYDDDVCHEQFNNHTYEAASRDSNGSTHAGPGSSAPNQEKQAGASQKSDGHAIPGFFTSDRAAKGSNGWSPADPIVEPWMAPGDQSAQDDGLNSSPTNSGSEIGNQSGKSQPGRSRSAAAERSQSRGRAFSPSGSNGRYSGSASPKVHNGSIHRSARAHNGASAGGRHQQTNASQPGIPGAVRVSNGAQPRSSREERSEQRHAAGRDGRSQSLPHIPLQGEVEPSSNGVDSSSKAQSNGFWEQQSAPSGRDDSSNAHTQGAIDDDVAGVQQSAHEAADSQPQNGEGMYSPSSAQPFFSSHMPSPVHEPVQAHEADDIQTRVAAESFFKINPTLPKGYQAGTPAHYPRRPVPKLPPATKRSRTDPKQKGVLQTEFPAKDPPSPRQSESQPVSSDRPSSSQEVEQKSNSDVQQDIEDPRTGSDKCLEPLDDHASRTFARAVSHSSLPSAMPEHSVRRGAVGQRNSAMRRSSRRDAHMQTRIANLDTSNLSHYSLPTLQRLAKDMGLSNFGRLSKSELVVQLVAEIILANMTLGWSVPEVAHGHLDEADGDEAEREGEAAQPLCARAGSRGSGSPRSGSRLAGSPRTVYRFGKSYDSEDEGHGSDVEVTPEVPPDTVQRGQDVFSRLKQWLPFGGAGGPAAAHDHTGAHVQQRASEGRQGEKAQPGQSRLVTGAAQVSLGGANVEDDFESLSALSMNKLQELCEDLGVEGWQRMRKYEMVGALLMDVYGLQH